MIEGTDEVERPLGAWNSIRKDLTVDDLSTLYSHQITNLHPNSTYLLQVVSYNDIGSSRPNTQFIFTTPVANGK